jgi:hypothetical protein
MPMLVFPPSSSKVTREAILELRHLFSKNQSCRISDRKQRTAEESIIAGLTESQLSLGGGIFLLCLIRRKDTA